jgi:hypothetical protein
MLSLRRGFILGFTLCVLACLGGCRRPATAVLAHEERANPDVVPHLRDADDMGRFIAGLPATPGSPLATLQASDAWREHRRQLDEVWGKAEGSLIKGLEDFQHQELNRAPLQSSLVFYPFGGPDALTLTLCFPQNATYVMVGLEPAGTLPGIPQIEKRGLPKYLAEMRNAVDSELSRSFFVTRQMDAGPPAQYDSRIPLRAAGRSGPGH